MITIVDIKAEDQKSGMSLAELKVFMMQVDNAHVGHEVSAVKIKTRIGWGGTIKSIKAEIHYD